jgi:DNA polymerase I-like protein with 3'-5' exonuclease and polymerase domains
MSIVLVTVDLETTVNGGQKSDSPEAHYTNNRVLVWGYRAYSTTRVNKDCKALRRTLIDIIQGGDTPRIIGHNLKFDLKYMIRYIDGVDWTKCQFYCTMYNEYRDSGHRKKFTSLEDACNDCGVRYVKGLDLGVILASGTKMEDIPYADLEKYGAEDVDAAYNLYHAQVGNPNYKYCSHDHVLPLAHMELLGLTLDVGMTKTKMYSLASQEASLGAWLRGYVESTLQWDDNSTPFEADTIKWMAPRTISYILTGYPEGGIAKGTKRNAVLVGNPILSKAQIAQVWGKKKPTNLGYPMAKGNLEDVGLLGAGMYVSKLLEYRGIQKLMGTYYGPFLEEAKIQGTIHPKMNMCIAATGRLSSSNPNGQNMPEVARECFVSEFGEFQEIDFKQLEVVALAIMSQCPVLIKDIQDGVDLHYQTGKDVFGWTTPNDMNEKDRKIVKGVNFGLIYGGGANGLAFQTGQPIALVKQLIAAFYSRYPRVAEWQKEFYTLVTQNLQPGGFKNGEQFYTSTVEEPIYGRRYTFVEGDAPAWVRAKTGRKFSFKPTETKNYPVQGFAGGDIVMMALVLLYKELYHVSTTEIRMTVHDSILVDSNLTNAELNKIMKKVCAVIVSNYRFPFDLKFDIQSGKHWQ